MNAFYQRIWNFAKRRKKWLVLFFLLIFLYLNNSSLLAEPPGGKPILLAHRGLGHTFAIEGITDETCTADREIDCVPARDELLEPLQHGNSFHSDDAR